MKIVFTGGGTAGHIFPIVSIVREMRKAYPYGAFDLYYIGPKDKFASELLSREGIKIKTILAGKIRRYFSFQNFIDILKFPIGLIQAFYHVFVISPDLVFSKGGYGSIPAVIAAKLLVTPIFLHESDVVPGLANRIAGKFSLEIFTSFPVRKTEKFPKKKMISVGNPVRRGVLEGMKEGAKKAFNLTGEKPTLFFIGGSLGAQKINETLLIVLPNILDDFEVIHQTGIANFEMVNREAKVVIKKEEERFYHPLPFLKEKELAQALAAADLIISRAGSGSIFEIAAVGKPSVLVPLKGSAQDHQVKNAYAFAEVGGTLVIEESNFRPHFLLERIKYLFSQPERLKQMGERAKWFARPEAGRVIAEYIVEYLSQ